MKLNDKLIQEGFTESIIQFAHNRTKMKHLKIDSAFLFSKNNDTHVVKLSLEDGRIVCYEINLANIRQKKLNLFLSK